MTENFIRASQFNNEGVRLYAGGEWSRAIECFRRALQCIVLQAPQEHEPTMKSIVLGVKASGLSIASIHLSALSIGDDHRERSPQPASSSREVESLDAPVLCDKPLVFEEVLDQSADSMAVTCAVLVFNLAVSSHQKFIESGDKGYLVKALRLYDFAVESFFKVSQHYEFAGVISEALNNKLLLYYYEEMFEDLERDLATLSRIAPVANQNKTTRQIMDTAEFQEVMLNLLLLRRPIVAQAA